MPMPSWTAMDLVNTLSILACSITPPEKLDRLTFVLLSYRFNIILSANN